MKKILVAELHKVNSLKTHTVAKAPILNDQQNYPIVLFSPGFGSPQETYLSYLEELASHGYIVFGINYPYVTNPTIFPDGRIIAQSPLFNQANAEEMKAKEFETWLKDLNFIVDQLEVINKTNEILKGKIDKDAIGVMGHSFGGRVTVEFARQNKFVKAGIDLDGKLSPDVSTQNFDKPFMFIVAECKDNKDQRIIENLQKHITKDAFVIIVKNADHGTFTDLNLVFKPWLYQNNIDPEKGINIVRSFIVAFFDKYLKGKSINILTDENLQYNDIVIQKN